MNYLKKVFQSKAFIIAAIAILTYSLSGFLLAPYIVRHYVPKAIEHAFKKQAAIGEVRVNPYILTFEANEFHVDESNGLQILGFKKFFVDFELKSLFKWAWTFRQVSLEGPLLNAVIHKDGRLNLADLVPSKDSSSQKKGGQLPRLIFEQITIDQGQINFADQRQTKPAAIIFKPLNLKMKNLNTLPGRAGAKTIIATSSDGETFKWTGDISLNPVGTNGRFSIENLRTSTISEFVGDALNIEEPTGKLTVTADYRIDLKDEKAHVVMTNLSAGFTDIALKLQGAETPLLELPDILISGGRFDLSNRQLDIDSIAVKGGRSRLVVDEHGTLNIQRIIKHPETTGSSATLQPFQDKHTKPWKIKLSTLDVGGFAVDYKDLSRTPALNAVINDLRVGLKAQAETGDQQRVLLNDLMVGATGVQAGFLDTTEPVLRINAVALDGGTYDLAANRFAAAKISIKGGNADVRRQVDGAINMALLFKPHQKGAVAKKHVEAVAKGHPFRFLVQTVLLSGLQVAFYDVMIHDNTPVLNLDDVSASISEADGRSPTEFDLGIKVLDGGLIKISGTVDPSIPSVESEVQVTELSLDTFQPYVNQALTAILKSGTFSTHGTLSHGIKAAGAETVYQGWFNIKQVRLTETGQKEMLVGWKSVQSDRFKLQLGPNGIDIGEVKVEQPAGKIIIEKNGVFNLTRVIKSDAEPNIKEKHTTEDTADAFPYRIHRVLIDDGQLDFADLSLPIPFRAIIHKLKGILVGISSTKNAGAQIKLDGHVDDYGIAKVEGELNTSNPRAFTDIDVIFRNVEMSKLSPYSGKFAGREINSGKLSVDLKYKIDKNQLLGDNQIVVERLALGEKVKSPDAVNLPIELAVALLKDSNGVIDLGLPVKGNLDSPEFSYGTLIGKALANLLTEIVTSPFRALGALIPGGEVENFKDVVFEPGSANVSPPEREKLTKLAGALKKRPQLKLVVQGRYNPETDRTVFRTESLKRTLATRLNQNLAPNVTPGPVDYSSPETGKALEAMFSERFGADALKTIKAELKVVETTTSKEATSKRNAGLPAGKPEDPGHLAKLLFTRLEKVVPVEEDALIRLADVRAYAVIAELSGPQGISPERLHTKASASLNKADPVTVELSLEVGQ